MFAKECNANSSASILHQQGKATILLIIITPMNINTLKFKDMKSKIFLLLSLCLMSIGTVFGQSITVKGVVLDENSESIIGATFVLKTIPLLVLPQALTEGLLSMRREVSYLLSATSATRLRRCRQRRR